MELLAHQVQPLIDRSILEDIGYGDVTVAALVDERSTLSASIIAREPGTVSGLSIVKQVFLTVDSSIVTDTRFKDGDQFNTGAGLMTVQGPAGSVLSAERTALNFFSHVSGIATATRKYVEAVQGTKARICCTRKTLPGLRLIQKYAVRCGGGFNHRFALDGAVLIKDNHIATCGSIGAAIAKAKSSVGHMTPIEIEIDTLDQLDEMADFGIHAILLDNMSLTQLETAVRVINGRCLIEASGGITLGNVVQVASTGVDVISVGALTHSVRSLDFGLDFASDTD